MVIKQILLGQTSQRERGNSAAAEQYSEQALAFLTPEEIKDILAELGEQSEDGYTIPSLSLPTYFQQTYVALATILPEEQRVQASCAGLCFVQILDLDKEAQQYHIGVAAISSFLDAANPGKVQHLTLTKNQLRQMLPWDRTLQRLETCCVREVLQVYVYRLGAVEISAHPYKLEDDSLPVQQPTQAPDVQRKRSKVVWTALPEVFVSATTAQDLADRIKKSAEHGGKKTCPQRLFWLKTMIAALNRQLQHLNARSHAAFCDLCTKLLATAEGMVSAFKRRNRLNNLCFLVNAIPLRQDGHWLGWHLVIWLPQAALQQWEW